MWGKSQSHKYIARVKVNPLRYRYFYTQAEYNAYLHPNNSNVQNGVKPAKTFAVVPKSNATNGVVTEKAKSLASKIASGLEAFKKAVEKHRKDAEERARQKEREKVHAETQARVEHIKQENAAEAERKFRADSFIKLAKQDQEKTKRSADAIDNDTKLSDDQVKEGMKSNPTWNKLVEMVDLDADNPISDKNKEYLVNEGYMYDNETWSHFAQRQGLVYEGLTAPKSFDELKHTEGEMHDDADMYAVNHNNLWEESKKDDYMHLKDRSEYPEGSAIGWCTNCAYCTLAYDFRKRGYDVEATAASTLTSNTYDEIESWYEGGKFDKSTTVTRYHMNKMFNSSVDANGNARGQFCVMWNGGGGHSMSYEVKNGEAIIRDCQTNKKYTVDEWYKECGDYVREVAVMRTDDKELTEKALRGVKNR